MDQPHWLESLVGQLVPPAAREYVLGDLHERHHRDSAAWSPVRYLLDAMRTAPFVVWSHARRDSPLWWTFAQLMSIYAIFMSGALFTVGVGGFLSLSARVIVPTGVMLVIVWLFTPYLSRPTQLASQVRLVVAAAVGVFLVNRLLLVLAPALAVPWGVLRWGAMIAAGSMPTMRVLWGPPRTGRLVHVRTAALTDDVGARALRLARDTRRRTYVGYVVTLGLACAFAWQAIIAHNIPQQLGAAMTALASLFLATQGRVGRAFTVAVQIESDGHAAYRAALIKERDFHSGARLWWRLAVMVPGYLLFLFGSAVVRPALAYRWAMIAVAFLLFGALAILLNRHVAKRFAEQVEELESSLR